MIMSAAALAAVFEAGENILTLIEGLEETEFARSRVTRFEVRRQLQHVAMALAALDEAAHTAMPEIDWAGWRTVDLQLNDWFAARSLVPATLMWLQVYRRAEPALFDFRP